MSNQNKIPQPKTTSEDSTIWLHMLKGYVKTITSAPTYTPKNFEQAIKLYMDSLTTPTVKRLYIYSFEAGIWSYISLT